MSSSPYDHITRSPLLSLNGYHIHIIISQISRWSWKNIFTNCETFWYAVVGKHILLGLTLFCWAKLDLRYSVTLKGNTIVNSLCRQFCKKRTTAPWDVSTLPPILILILLCCNDVAPVILLRYCREISLILLLSPDMSLIGLWWSCD